jgi:hypothetical protein
LQSCSPAELGIHITTATFTFFNPLKPTLALILFKYSVRTAKKTQHFTITKINWLMVFKEIIAVYSENHTKPINTICVQNAMLLVAKAGGNFSYQWVVNG